MNSERKAYLNGLAEEYGLPPSAVFFVASTLGESEDEDGLISALEDLSDEYERGEWPAGVDDDPARDCTKDYDEDGLLRPERVEALRADSVPANPDDWTWRDLHRLVKRRFEILGADYVNLDDFGPEGIDPDTRVWTDDVHWIACYVVRGGSEGWYVHVDVIPHDRQTRKPYMLAKFWSLNEALRASEILTRLTYQPEKPL